MLRHKAPVQRIKTAPCGQRLLALRNGFAGPLETVGQIIPNIESCVRRMALEPVEAEKRGHIVRLIVCALRQLKVQTSVLAIRPKHQ